MRRRPYSSYRRALPRPPRSRYVPRPVCQNVFIKRMVEYPPFTVSGIPFTWNSSNYSFKLLDVPSFGELTGLFDQFRILKVKVTWIPHFRDAQRDTSTNNAYASPIIYYTSSDDGTSNLTTKLEATTTCLSSPPSRQSNVGRHHTSTPCAMSSRTAC